MYVMIYVSKNVFLNSLNITSISIDTDVFLNLLILLHVRTVLYNSGPVKKKPNNYFSICQMSHLLC